MTDNKTTHTKGPWRVRPFDDLDTKVMIEAESQKESEAYIACVSWWSIKDGMPRRSEQIANAYLMAAAPMLVSALEKVLYAVGKLKGGDRVDDANIAYIKVVIKDVLAKLPQEGAENES